MRKSYSPTPLHRQHISEGMKGIVGYWKHRKPSQETIEKRRQKMIGHWGWNKGKKYNVTISKELRKIRSDRMLGENNPMFGKSVQAKINGLKGLITQQNMKEPTSIEKTLYDYLLLKGILFEKQRLINGKFIVDAYIPSLNLIIEADGKYWHSLDKVVKKDKAENAYLKKCGFNMIRLTEEEINNGGFKERLVI